MVIKELKVMRGPNVWSQYRKKVIVMCLDIEELEDFPTDKIDGFADRMEKLMPSLYTHRCSEDDEGGFFYRVRKGTWMGHVVEHIALEIQSLAGMDCGFGRTRSTKQSGVYNVLFAYLYEQAGKYAAKAAVEIADALVKNREIDINEYIDTLKNIMTEEAMGPSTAAIVKEAEKRNIPWRKIDDSFILFGQGIHQKKISAAIAGSTSGIGIDVAGDKGLVKKILSKACIPVPQGSIIFYADDLKEALENCSYPVAIKPRGGNHGRGVRTNIQSYEEALDAFHQAKKISSGIIVEQYIKGYDYRFLIVNYKVVAVAMRTPPSITGDGKHTIEQLIGILNNDKRRGKGHENVLTKINVDENTASIISARGFSMDTVLPAGSQLSLKHTANLSSGGIATDVTEFVHPHNIFMAERIARIIDLDICGIDIIAADISLPLEKTGGCVIEVNAAPGLRMHLAPSVGLARNVAAPIVKMLYPDRAPCRIPVIAVTGTNGKTTTTRLIAHIAQHAGHHVGFTTTDGIYINKEAIFFGDCSGPSSAETVLSEPTVDFAVLECARGGILRSGLGFDNCDISIVTNVTEDHLGLNGIDTLEEMAKVKAVVPQSTFDHGYAILNADDDNVYAMRRSLDCNIALFSMHAGNERIERHCKNGGMAAVLENGSITICDGEWKMKLEMAEKIPLTLSGRAECMIKNTLPAVLAAYISKFDIDIIKAGLLSFIPSPETTPGRYNIFKFRQCEVMVDYAHNADGYKELKKFLETSTSPSKIGIVAATGDRREEDIKNVGRYAADMFSKIIIRHDKDARGNSHEKMDMLMTEGAREVNADVSVTVIAGEEEALKYALRIAERGCFIVLCADNPVKTIELVNSMQLSDEEEEKILDMTIVKAS